MSHKPFICCRICAFSLICLLFLQSAVAQSDTASLSRLIEEKKIQWGNKVAVMVWKENRVAYQKFSPEFGVNAQQPIGYASSWLTAALVMTFVDQKKISLDDKVSRYLPIFSKYAKGYLTIRQCLANTTGLEPDKGGIQRFFQKTKFATLEDEVNAFASGREIIQNPGEVFYYNHIGANIAGRVLEVVGKKSFDRLAMERIFRPLGMKKTSFSSEYAVNPSRGAVSSPGDYLKFLAMLLNNGTLGTKTILSPGSVAEMQKVQTGNASHGFSPPAASGFAYGLGNWIQEKDDKGNGSLFSCPGLSGGWPYIDKLNGYACVIFVEPKEKEDKKEGYLEIVEKTKNTTF